MAESSAGESTTRRLDVELPARGLARSRAHAAQLIALGQVRLDGRVASKASAPVSATSKLELVGADGHVSRAAGKLVAALDAFAVALRDRLVLDVGASTGGFTQVALEHGARRVIALDVGHGQLAPSLRVDPRVVVVEGENARELTAARLADITGIGESPTVIVADLSFISLTLVLPALVASAPAVQDWLLLVKPQFEVGRTGVREGVVRDPALRAQALRTVLAAAEQLGLGVAGLIDSPIEGGAGNREYLLWLNEEQGRAASAWEAQLQRLAADRAEPSAVRGQ